jgi:hypothetical protein
VESINLLRNNEKREREREIRIYIKVVIYTSTNRVCRRLPDMAVILAVIILR